MYNAWTRSKLRLSSTNLISAPPFHSIPFNKALAVIPTNCKQGLILNVSTTEPHLAVIFEILSQELGITDVSWGPDGQLYLLRAGGESNWQVDRYQLFMEEDDTWTVQRYGSIRHDTIEIATCLAVQSRLGGLILGTMVGDLYLYDDVNGTPRRLGRWAQSEAIGIVKVKRDRFIACVTVNGRLSLALASSASPQILSLCTEEKVSTVSFSHELPTLAVGLFNSPPRVRLYEYGWESNRLVAIATRELVVFGPSLVEEERWLGGVKDLDFGTGSSIACLFHGRMEPIVFHATSARRTTSGSATHHFSYGKRSNGESEEFKELLMQGTKHHSITWCGTSLFCINEVGELFREGFSRHAVQASLHRNDSSRFAVLGSDYCSILSLEGNPRWTRYDCPNEYIENYGPLVKVAIDDDKSRIAVAGKRGFCVFFAHSRKWRKFQSEILENKVIVGGLVWMPTSHLCVVAAVNESEWEFQIYDMSERRLDVAPVFNSGPLVGLPIAVDFVKRTSSNVLFVALFASGIQVYSYANGKLLKSLDFIHRSAFVELGFLTHLVLVPSKMESVLPRCVLLDSAGRCCVISLETQETFTLASKLRVADAWTKMDATLGVITWTVVDGGLKLWVPNLDPVGELYQSSPVLDIAFPEIGSLPVGSDEDAFITFQAHSYDIRASKSPLLHGILSWLLRKSRDSLARRVLAERRFSKSIRIVRAALEDLLQGALLGENQVDVRKVVNLLGCVPFEVMAAVVARCARQIDPGLWEVLFSFVGAPRDLFEQCLVRFDSLVQEKRGELILIAAELLPIVDADKDDPQDGPILRAKEVLKRCESGGTLEKEVYEYAEKRGLDISNGFTHEENGEGDGVVSTVLKFLSGF